MGRIVGQSLRPSSAARVWVGAGAVYGVAAFAPAMQGGHAPADPAWSVVPFCAAFALAFVPWGRWADRHGAAAAMRAASALLLVGGLFLMLPLGDGGWAAARALEGLAAAGFPPAAQAALAALGGPGRTGRAIGGMSIAVAVGTLLLPLVVELGEGTVGTSGVLAAGALGLPLLALAAVTPLRHGALPRPARDRPAVRLPRTAGLVAAWACAFLVLTAYWTVVTRAAPLLGPDGAGLTDAVARAVPLAGGILGIVLTPVVAAVADRGGPRAPMVLVLAAGSGALALAAAAGDATVAALGVAAFSAAYWCYLTLVGLQVVRSAPAAAHGRALGGLYTAMWSGAAAGGALAALGIAWATVLAACAACWLLAVAVAARWFLGAAPALRARTAAVSALDAATRAS